MELILRRLEDYHPVSKQEELNAFKEVCQEIALAALKRTGFFEHGAFQGGTCLRIVHKLDRFSEDLDFILRDRDPSFCWSPFLHAMEDEFAAHGLHLTAEDRSRASTNVKKAFLKENSFGQVLSLQYPRTNQDSTMIRIKLEIDTNPPGLSGYSTHVINFPYPFSIVAQDLPSLFAGKCTALLCRKYIKGRDWYDLLWYLRHRVQVNYPHLREGLFQHPHFQNIPVTIDENWLRKALEKKIQTIDWTFAQTDVRRFLRADRQHVVQEWSADLFLQLIQNL